MPNQLVSFNYWMKNLGEDEFLFWVSKGRVRCTNDDSSSQGSSCNDASGAKEGGANDPDWKHLRLHHTEDT
jgi:hypothetical protein